MNKWLKRIRGAVGVGLTWAVGWGFVGALMGLWLQRPGGVVASSVGIALAGFLSGGAFSVVLGLAGRRRTFEEMSLPRFAGFGALATLVMFLTVTALQGTLGFVWTLPGLIVTTFWTLLGAGSAAGSLALARMADDGEALDAGETSGLIEGR